MNELIGARLTTARRERPGHITQQRLADMAKKLVSRSSVANIERGRQGISLQQLYVLARILKIEVQELLPAVEEVFQEAMDPISRVGKSAKPKDRKWLESVGAFKKER